MPIAYIDDSGDTNPALVGTDTFTLGCVVVEFAQWQPTFDAAIAWRRSVRARWSFPTRDELKANYLIHSKGTFAARTHDAAVRHAIYREAFELIESCGLKAFAVVIDKRKMTTDPGKSFDHAWTFLLQRLQHLSTPENPLVIFHDEGEEQRVRALARRARRAGGAGSAFGPGFLRSPLAHLIDDPIPRSSKENYLIQLADLVAYAAYRKLNPRVRENPVCPNDMWDVLGGAIYLETTSLKPGRAPGIVEWPK